MSKITPFYKAPRYLFRKHNILSMLKDKPEIKSFLDVGCGAGELACTLAEKGMKGIAVDFSVDAIEVASNMRDSRGINEANLQFKLGGLENVSGKKYDVVSCLEVLEHIKNDKKFLKELVEYSKKYILISVPAKQRLFDSSDESVGHFRRYEKPDLIKTLNDAGLDIVKFVNYGYPFTDIVRVGRKAVFDRRLRKNQNESMNNRSKDSGINPIKLPKALTGIDIEKAIIPFYLLSTLFNKTNLGEGYLVLCVKQLAAKRSNQ